MPAIQQIPAVPQVSMKMQVPEIAGKYIKSLLA